MRINKINDYQSFERGIFEYGKSGDTRPVFILPLIFTAKNWHGVLGFQNIPSSYWLLSGEIILTFHMISLMKKTSLKKANRIEKAGRKVDGLILREGIRRQNYQAG